MTMRIDVHAHYFPDRYLDRLERYGSQLTDVARHCNAAQAPAEMSERFVLMAKAGVSKQLLSVGPQLPFFDDPDRALSAAQEANDLYAEVVASHPNRFIGLAALPLPHVDRSLAEIEHAFDKLDLAGVCFGTSVLGQSIADPQFDSIYEELNRRGAILYLHPSGTGADSSLIREHNLTWAIGAPIEDTIGVMHLIMRGIPQRFPNIRIIVSHFGGALPMLLGRLDAQAGWLLPEGRELPSQTARRMWYDTASHSYAPALRCACGAFGADRLLFGNDFPYKQGDEYADGVDYIFGSGLDAAQADDIANRNATLLLNAA
jgi:6-methylsalicylate decarboxylase